MKYAEWVLEKLRAEIKKFGEAVCEIRWAPFYDDMKYEMDAQDDTGESYT